MTTRLLPASIATLALIASGAAQAADMPARILKAPTVIPATVDWSGFYIGGHGGFAWSRLKFTFTDDLDNDEAFRFSPSSFIGGGQVGLLQQYDKWVLGFEGTWSALDLNGAAPSTVSAGQSTSIKIDQIATATVRFGAIWDQALLYGKAGYAAANINIHSSDPVAGLTADSTRWRSGWTVGTGFDYMLFRNIVVGAEFDFYNIHFDTDGLYSDGATPFLVSGSAADIYSITARVSWLFH